MIFKKKREEKIRYTKLFTKQFRDDIEYFKLYLEEDIDGNYDARKRVAASVLFDLAVVKDRLSKDVYEAIKFMYLEELDTASRILQRPIP